MIIVAHYLNGEAYAQIYTVAYTMSWEEASDRAHSMLVRFAPKGSKYRIKMDEKERLGYL